jgi:hypothetical protein
MIKRNFLIFVLLSLTIVLIGVIFLILDKDMFIPGFTNDTKENIIVNGWPIVVIGVVMLLIGLLGKWSDNNDQRKNKDIRYPPPMEEVDKNHRRFYGE